MGTNIYTKGWAIAFNHACDWPAPRKVKIMSKSHSVYGSNVLTVNIYV